jgi:glyceraldehyde 3-phosphate dehydrogenase
MMVFWTAFFVPCGRRPPSLDPTLIEKENQMKIGINGFGRIGRVFFRAAVREGLDIAGINDLTDAASLGHLLKYDSVHGRADFDVKVSGNSLIVNGKEIKISAERDPANLPWAALGVDTVIEATGLFTDRDKASKHLDAGAKRVLISAPSKDADKTIVYGVNHTIIDKAKDVIISNASCTTNCLTPVAKVLLDEYGIKRGLMTTIHSYTNDQKILDLPHKDLRRARAAALNMIPTSTGAAKAVALVLPELKGKLDGLAVRVPTPNVSLVDLTVELGKEASVEQINGLMKKAAEGSFKGVLEYTDEPLVSIDFNGNTHSSIFDASGTFVIQGSLVKVMAWYDNEVGFSNRLVDLCKYLG